MTKSLSGQIFKLAKLRGLQAFLSKEQLFHPLWWGLRIHYSKLALGNRARETKPWRHLRCLLSVSTNWWSDHIDQNLVIQNWWSKLGDPKLVISTWWSQLGDQNLVIRTHGNELFGTKLKIVQTFVEQLVLRKVLCNFPEYDGSNLEEDVRLLLISCIAFVMCHFKNLLWMNRL